MKSGSGHNPCTPGTQKARRLWSSASGMSICGGHGAASQCVVSVHLRAWPGGVEPLTALIRILAERLRHAPRNERSSITVPRAHEHRLRNRRKQVWPEDTARRCGGAQRDRGRLIAIPFFFIFPKPHLPSAPRRYGVTRPGRQLQQRCMESEERRACWPASCNDAAPSKRA